ncbi:MAG: 4'-phosphopantetheinyl transferase superfamily protein [Myxococcota bacterium]|nr:4'-phosphopantetheinyl transferase superfamily protein [Myxococcota bacterium]
MSGRAKEPVWHSVGEHELPADRAWLSESERERAQGFRFAKRRNDYLLGRYVGKAAVAARLALATESEALRRIEIRNQQSGPERGAPSVWIEDEPVELEVSITDRAGWGVCLLGPKGARVGCDLELVEPRSDAFVADYLTARERDFVRESPDEATREIRANAIWSAKESALKVLRTGLRRDTRSVEIELEQGGEAGSWRALQATLREGPRFRGWWLRTGDFLLTVASEAPLPSPRPLADPAPLLEARPSHRWMAQPLLDS